MQLTKGAIGNLINRYKAVLKKCHLMNTFGSLAVAGMLVMGGAGVAAGAPTAGIFVDTNAEHHEDVNITGAYDIGVYAYGAKADFSGKQLHIATTPGTGWGSVNVGLWANSTAPSDDRSVINFGQVGATESINIAVTDNAQKADTSIGVWSRGDQNKAGGEINLNAETVTIKGHSNSGWIYGIYAQNTTTTTGYDRATININAGKTYIDVTSGEPGRANAIVAMSQGVINIESDLYVNTQGGQGNAIVTRGDSIITINSSGTHTVQMNGNVNFNYDGPTSGTKVDADVDITLSGADSYWNGNTLISWNGTPSDPSKLDVSEMTLTVKDGATWTPTAISNSDSQKYTALNKLTLDGGIVDVNKGVEITIENIDGKGAITNAGSVTIEKGSIEGPITFEKGDATADNMVTVGKDGITTLTGGVAGSGTIDKLAIAEDGETTITNAKLSGHDGRALWNNGTLTVNGGSFEGNKANVAGAIYNAAGAKLTVDGVTFASNSSAIAGAINNRDGTVTITNSTFKGNDAGKSMGGAIRNDSGDIQKNGTITITGSTFEGNTAGNGGAVWNGSNGKVEITDSTFKGNTAVAEGGLGQGGAITNADQMTITGSTFEGNQAGKIGGAIFNAASGKLDFNGTNTFTNNTAAGKANDIYNAGTITVKDGTTTLNSGLILAAGSTTDVSGGALVINGNTTWEKGDNLGSLTVNGGALTLQKGDVLEGYDKAKENTSLSVNSGSLYLINKDNYTAKNFTAAKKVLNVNNASFGFVGGQLVDDGGNVTGLVVSGNTIGADTKFDTDGLTDTTVNNSSFLKNDLTVKADATDVTINGADVAVNKVNIGTSATGDKSLTINNNGSLTVVGGNANDKLIAANGTDDLTTINVYEGKLNLGSAAMPERGAGTLGKANITLDNDGSLNASNGDYTVGDVTGTGEVTADAANIKATGDVTAGDIDLVKGGSVTSDKNITVNGSIEDADGTLQAGGNITVQNDITKAGNGKLTVAAGGTIEAANISATNVAAKKLTASGDVAVDGGVLNLTGTDAADASTVKSLKLTNGTQASIAGSLQLGSGETLTVGTGDDTVGGTTLSAQHIDLNGGMLLVDPAWGLASSNVAVESLSAGSVGVGRNSYLALGTADTGWLPGVVGNYTKGVGLSETGITAALGVFKGIEIAAGKNLTVDGSKTGTEINTGWTSSGATNSATFADNSLLVINGQNIYGDKAAISFKNPGTLSVAEGAKLLVTDAVAGQTYTIVGNVTNPATNLAGWKNNGMTSTTDMISLGDAKFDGTDKVTTSATRNDAHTVFPNLSDGMANAVNDLYTGHAGAAGQPNWDYADVNSDQMGVRFLSRATDNRFLGMDKNAAAESIESAARIAFAGAAPQMTRMASDAGTNAVVNRLGFADPADGAQAMDAEGKIVDRNTTGFALWIAPLWQSQHGWGLDAGNMDYGFNGNLGGVSLGADYTFENAIRAGITFNIGGGYAESSGGDLSSTENRMNFWGLGAYAGWNYENFGVMADVSYTSTWNQLKQDLDSRLGMGNKLEADVQASAISAGLRAEYLLQTSAMDIIPHIGVRYMSLNTWGYDVDTHGGTVLEGDSLHQDIWTFPIGVTFSKDFALDSGWNFKPSLDFTVIPAAGDIKAKHDVHFTGLPGTYEVETQMMDYLTWQGGVGLELANDNMSIGVNYTLQAGQHTTGHGVFGSFRYEF